eukprot:587897-Prorocentrum_minimum.AAC.1
MLLANLDLAKGLGNGARGLVTGFEDTASWTKKFVEGKDVPLHVLSKCGAPACPPRCYARPPSE